MPIDLSGFDAGEPVEPTTTESIPEAPTNVTSLSSTVPSLLARPGTDLSGFDDSEPATQEDIFGAEIVDPTGKSQNTMRFGKVNDIVTLAKIAGNLDLTAEARASALAARFNVEPKMAPEVINEVLGANLSPKTVADAFEFDRQYPEIYNRLSALMKARPAYVKDHTASSVMTFLANLGNSTKNLLDALVTAGAVSEESLAWVPEEDRAAIIEEASTIIQAKTKGVAEAFTTPPKVTKGAVLEVDKGVIGATFDSARQVKNLNELGNLSSDLFYKIIEQSVNETPERAKEIAELELRIDQLRWETAPIREYPTPLAQGVSELADVALQGPYSSYPAMAQGVLLNAGTHAAAWGLRRVGVPVPTKVVSATAKMLVASNVYRSTYKSEFGQGFDEFRRNLDADGDYVLDGEKLDPNIAIGTLIMSSAFKAMIEVQFFPSEAKMFGPVGEGLVSGSFKDVLKNIVKQGTKSDLLREIGKNFVTASVGQGKEEFWQQGWDVVKQHIDAFLATGDPKFETIFTDLAEMTKAGVGGVVGGMTTSAPAAFVRLAAVRWTAQSDVSKAQQAVALLKGLEGAKGNELLEKAPNDVANMIVSKILDGGDASHIHVDVAPIAEAISAGKVSIDDVARAAGMTAEQVADHVSSGARLDVPVATFMTSFHSLPIELQDDITLGTKTMNDLKAEAQAFKTELNDEKQLGRPERALQMEKLNNYVKDWTNVVRSLGVNEKSATAIAEVAKRFIRTMLVRNLAPGVDVADLAEAVLPIVKVLKKDQIMTKKGLEAFGERIQQMGDKLGMSSEVEPSIIDKAKESVGLEKKQYQAAWKNTKTGQIFITGEDHGVADLDRWGKQVASGSLGVSETLDLANAMEGSENSGTWQRGYVSGDKFSDAASLKVSRTPNANEKTSAELLRQGTSGWAASIPRSEEEMKLGYELRKRSIVALTSAKNLHTFLHEMGHVFFDNMFQLANRANAPTDLKDMLVDTLEYVGVPRSSYEVMRFVFVANAKKRSNLLELGRKIVEAKLRLGEKITSLDPRDNLDAADTIELNNADQMFERFAVGFTDYLYKGEAPSVSLASAFVRFKFWLRQFWRRYRYDITEYAPGATANPLITGVFDRMLATDNEIARMHAWRDQVRLIRSPAELNQSPAQFLAYLKNQAQSLKLASSQLEIKTMGELADVIDGEKKDLYDFHMREIISAKWFEKYEQVGLFISEGALTAQGAADAVQEFVKNDGTHPDADTNARLTTALQIVAATLKISDVVVMTNLIRYSKDPGLYIKRAIEREAARRTEIDVKKMDLPDSQTIKGSAETYLRNKYTENWLLMELDALRTRTQQGPGGSPKFGLQEAAKDLVKRLPLSVITGNHLSDVEQRYAESAMRLAAEGKFAEAYVAKQQQLIHFYMLRESGKGLKIIAEFRKVVRKLAKRGAMEEIAHGGKEFVDAVSAIVHVTTPRGLAGKFTPDMVDMAIQRMQTDGMIDIRFDPDIVKAAVAQGLSQLASGMDRKNVIRGFSIEQLTHLKNALAQMRKAARDSVAEYNEGVAEHIDVIATEISTDASETTVEKDLPSLDLNVGDSETGSAVWAALMDTQRMTERLGKTAIATIWRRFKDGQFKERGLSNTILAGLTNLVNESLPKEIQQKSHELLPADLLEMLPYDMEVIADGTQRTRGWLRMLLLNMGNPDNIYALMVGNRWTYKQITDFINEAIKRGLLTNQELNFAQRLWKFFDSTLYPHIAEKYERDNGLPPGKVIGAPLTLIGADGKEIKLEGGYFPIRYMDDAYRKYMETRRDLRSVLRDLRGVEFQGANVSHGFAVQRTHPVTMSEVLSYEPIRETKLGPEMDQSHLPPLNLNWDVVTSHVNEVVHWLAYDDFVRFGAKLFNNPIFINAVTKYMGSTYNKQFQGWLGAVARGHAWNVEKETERYWRTLYELRMAASRSLIGASLTVPLADFATLATAVAAGDIRADDLVSSVSDAMLNWGETRARSLALSQELNIRADSVARNRRIELATLGKRGRGVQFGPQWVRQGSQNVARFRDFLVHAGWAVYDLSDKIMSTVIWNAAFSRAKTRLMEGRTTELTPQEVRQIALEADDAVTHQLPSHDSVERSSVMRDRRLMVATSLFFGYFNKLGNVTDRIVHPVVQEYMREGVTVDTTYRIAKAAGATLAVYSSAFLLGELISGRGPEKEEEFSAWMARKMIASGFSIFPGGLDIAEPVAAYIEASIWDEQDFKPKFSERGAPWATIISRVFRDVKTLQNPDAADNETFGAGLDLFLIGTGLPAAQPVRTITWLTGASGLLRSDYQYPPEGILYGPERKK